MWSAPITCRAGQSPSSRWPSLPRPLLLKAVLQYLNAAISRLALRLPHPTSVSPSLVFIVWGSRSRLSIERSSTLFSLRQLFLRIHAATALLRAAAARRRILWIAVVKVVIVSKFFSRLDITDRPNDDSPLHLIRFAIGIATVIDESGDAVSIDHVFAID